MSLTFDEYRKLFCDELEKIKNPNNNTNISVDVNDPTDILAVFVNHASSALADLDEKLELYRQSLNPFTATGTLLRDVIQYRGITAKEGVATRTTVKFTGTNGTTIPRDSEIASDDGTKVFRTLSDCTILLGGQSVLAECTKIGAIPLADNELTHLVTPIMGVSKVINNNVVIGTDDETDDQLHARLDMYTTSIGNGALDNLDSALLNIPGVKSARTYIGEDNDKGLKAGDITSMVNGGDDEEIAQVIFDNNMFLLNTIGDISAEVRSELHDIPYTVKFSRPTPLEISSIKIFLAENDESLKDPLFEATEKFLDMLSPGSVFFMTKYLKYLDSYTKIPIVSAEFSVSNQKYMTYPLPWNKVFHISKEKFTVEKFNQ